MRLTVGSLPPAVYWRRRAIVFGAVLVVLFLIAQACMGSSPADDRVGAGPSPGSSASPGPAPTSPPAPLPDTTDTSPGPDDEPAGEDEDGGDDPGGSDSGAALNPEDCRDDEILVTAEASQTTFEVGEQVQFTIRIAHDSDRSCQRDVGGDFRELYLVRGAGAEHVWSSQHCANPTGSEVVELTDGWERAHHIGFTGQDTSSCSGPAAAGPELEPGEYQLRARLGTDRSEPVTITLA